MVLQSSPANSYSTQHFIHHLKRHNIAHHGKSLPGFVVFCRFLYFVSAGIFWLLFFPRCRCWVHFKIRFETKIITTRKRINPTKDLDLQHILVSPQLCFQVSLLRSRLFSNRKHSYIGAYILVFTNIIVSFFIRTHICDSRYMRHALLLATDSGSFL